MLVLCDWLTPSRNFSSDQYSTGNSFSVCVFFPVTQTSTRRDIIYSNLGLQQGLILLNPECRPDCADSLHPLCVLRSVAISIGQGLFFCCCCFSPRGVCEHRYSLVHILYCPANANRISETTTIGVEMVGGKHGAMSKVNRKQTSGFVRTSNSPKSVIKQSLLYLSTEKPIAQKSAIFFLSFRIHPCPQFFCLKGFRLVLYVHEKKRAQIISFFFFFLSIDVCCQTSYRITPLFVTATTSISWFFYVHLSAVRVCLLSWPPYFSTAIIIIYIRRPIFPVRTFLPGTSSRQVDVKNADTRIKNTENDLPTGEVNQ